MERRGLEITESSALALMVQEATTDVHHFMKGYSPLILDICNMSFLIKLDLIVFVFFRFFYDTSLAICQFSADFLC